MEIKAKTKRQELLEKYKHVFFKMFFILVISLLITAIFGGYLSPLILASFKSLVIGKTLTLFGHAFSKDSFSLISGYFLTFALSLGFFLFVLRERHGKKDRSGTWFFIVALLLAALGTYGYFALHIDRNMPVSPAPKSKKTGYRAEDRLKLENIIHQELKND